MDIGRFPLQWSLYKVTSKFCCLSRQVVSHDRDNKHDFVKTVPGKCWNLCVVGKTSPVLLYRFHCISTILLQHSSPFPVWTTQLDPRVYHSAGPTQHFNPQRERIWTVGHQWLMGCHTEWIYADVLFIHDGYYSSAYFHGHSICPLQLWDCSWDCCRAQLTEMRTWEFMARSSNRCKMTSVLTEFSDHILHHWTYSLLRKRSVVYVSTPSYGQHARAVSLGCLHNNFSHVVYDEVDATIYFDSNWQPIKQHIR